MVHNVRLHIVRLHIYVGLQVHAEMRKTLLPLKWHRNLLIKDIKERSEVWLLSAGLYLIKLRGVGGGSASQQRNVCISTVILFHENGNV